MNDTPSPISQAVLRELTVLGRSEFTLDEVWDLIVRVDKDNVAKDNGFHKAVLNELQARRMIEQCPGKPAYFRIAQGD